MPRQRLPSSTPAPNAATQAAATAAAGGPGRQPVPTAATLADLERRATELALKGQPAHAAVVREEALVAAQARHGDPSPEADRHKVLLAELVVLAAKSNGPSGPVQNAAIAAMVKKERAATPHGLGPRGGIGGGDPNMSYGSTNASRSHDVTLGNVSSIHGAGDAYGGRKPPKSAAGAATAAPVSHSLTLSQKLSFIDRLLAPGMTLPSTQRDPRVIALRGRVLMAQVDVLHRQGKSRAALPVANQGINLLQKAATMNADLTDAPDCSLELAHAHLTRCALLSKATHHVAALQAAHTALGMTLALEEEEWQQDTHNNEHAADGNSTGVSPSRARAADGDRDADRPEAKYIAASTEKAQARAGPDDNDDAAARAYDKERGVIALSENDRSRADESNDREDAQQNGQQRGADLTPYSHIRAVVDAGADADESGQNTDRENRRDGAQNPGTEVRQSNSPPRDDEDAEYYYSDADAERRARGEDGAQSTPFGAGRPSNTDQSRGDASADAHDDHDRDGDDRQERSAANDNTAGGNEGDVKNDTPPPSSRRPQGPAHRSESPETEHSNDRSRGQRDEYQDQSRSGGGAAPTEPRFTSALSGVEDQSAAAAAAVARTSGPRTRIYFGSFQAACYHNLAAEQEHLGLNELALESYQNGFELALLALGADKPMTQKLKASYTELFASVNVRHFASGQSSSQKDAVRAALKTPEDAVRELNESYRKTRRHREQLQKDRRKEVGFLTTDTTTDGAVISKHKWDQGDAGATIVLSQAHQNQQQQLRQLQFLLGSGILGTNGLDATALSMVGTRAQTPSPGGDRPSVTLPPLGRASTPSLAGGAGGALRRSKSGQSPRKSVGGYAPGSSKFIPRDSPRLLNTSVPTTGVAKRAWTSIKVPDSTPRWKI